MTKLCDFCEKVYVEKPQETHEQKPEGAIVTRWMGDTGGMVQPVTVMCAECRAKYRKMAQRE